MHPRLGHAPGTPRRRGSALADSTIRPRPGPVAWPRAFRLTADDRRPADPRRDRRASRPDARRLRRAHRAHRRARRLRHRLHLRLLGVGAVRLAEPDFGFLTQSEMADTARAVCRVSDAPVIVDADTGYGNALNVMRTVRDFQDAGAAGVFLEDQVWPKKCGHFQGKQVVADRGARGEDPRRRRRARRARPLHRRPHRRAPAARPRGGDRALPRLQGGGRRRAVRRGAAVGRGAGADRRRAARAAGREHDRARRDAAPDAQGAARTSAST